MQTVVLNADYTYLNVVSWRRAIKMLIKGKAEVLKEAAKQVSNYEGTFIVRVPIVLKLVKMVNTVYRNKIPYSRKNVYIRDNYRCQYCGTKSKKLSIDHVFPASRGGKTEFKNCVACCIECNNSKGSRTPEEADMRLLKQPYVPNIMEFLNHKMRQMGTYDFLKSIKIY